MRSKWAEILFRPFAAHSLKLSHPWSQTRRTDLILNLDYEKQIAGKDGKRCVEFDDGRWSTFWLIPGRDEANLQCMLRIHKDGSE